MATRRPTRPNPATGAAGAAASPRIGPRARLEAHARQVEQIILARQNAATGLLPASTAITVHGDYTHAWVRDNVYSILAVWALALAWRRVDADRAAALERPVVRLMRGLLDAMLRQAHKVERFKHTQDPLDALHAKYDTERGEPVVGDADWGHLQLDATALFVLMLAQMSASGLRIVEHEHELAFVQNLVHYLAKAYRTPDYGIWERGHKRNEGRAELNASSVGMAKAALEAIAGFDPLPGRAPAVQVIDDDIAHAREALQALLPRESESKETDGALLSIVGYPAFAVDDAELAERTRADVLAKLQGRYGCKRFLRDGHQTTIEDHSRLHYEPGEMQQFEHIESEWPLFFTYLLVDAALRGDAADAAQWRDRLEALMQERDGQRLLPELYFVPAEAVEAERAQPGSQTRVPNDNVPLVWAQSLYTVGVLLQEGLLDADALDPLGRRRRQAARAPVCVQVLLLAEDELLRARLAVHGVLAQTLDELAPLQLIDGRQLEAAFAAVGRWDALGLSGRPAHPLGSLTTSRLFEHDGGTALCLPPFAHRRGFYLALDNRLLVDQIDTELAYLHRHWRHAGQPLLVLPLSAPMLDGPGAEALLGYLDDLRCGRAEGVQLEPLAALLPRLSVCRLAGPSLAPAAEPVAGLASDVVPAWDEAATRVLSPAKSAAIAAERDPAALRRRLAGSRNPYEQAEIVAALKDCTGDAAPADWRAYAEALYARACRNRHWGIVRRAAGLLDIHDDALEDAVAQIVVTGRRIALGRTYRAGSVVERPLGLPALVERLRSYAGEDPRAVPLVEEIVLLLGLLCKADATLFSGTLTLQPWQSLQLLTGWLAREHGIAPAEAFEHLLELSPHAILGRLREVFLHEQDMAANLARLQALRPLDGAETLVAVRFPSVDDPPLDPEQGGWAGWREMSGAIARVPPEFHARVWGLLQHGPGLVIGDELDPGNLVDSTLARADSTAGERGFALQVDELLNRIQAPEYRQLCVETLEALSAIAQANPELRFRDPLVLDTLIATAVRIGWRERGADGADDSGDGDGDDLAEAWLDFYGSPPHRVANLIMAAVTQLLGPPDDAT